MAHRVQGTAWSYRVIEPGAVAAGEALRLVDRPCPEWPLARLLGVFSIDRMDREALTVIAGRARLSPSWRELAARLLERGAVEEWRTRLVGPDPPPAAG